MSTPLVTVVTPSYNQGRFIRATIESILSQDYPNIEYIIMDGGSTDETAAVASEYSSRLRFISERDKGQTDAINKGFRMAKGSVLSYINSDDLLLPGAVQKAVAALDAHPDVGAIYGDGFQIDIDGNIKSKFPFTEPFNLWKLTYLADYILQQSVFFRKDAVEAVGWFDESLHFGMDWDILVKLGKRFGLVYIPEELGSLREYAAAKSFSGAGKRFKELAALMRRQTGATFPPGYFFYGLDTYDKIWTSAIRKWVPRFLGGEWLAQKVFVACRSYIDHTQRHAQGLYADRWAARVMHYMLPASKSKTIRLRGNVIELNAGLRNQQISVFVNGQLAVSKPTPLGQFELNIPYESPSEAVTLRVESACWLNPAKAGLSPDNRDLAFILEEFNWF